MTSYHEYNKVDKARYLVGEIQKGKNVAIITDAGTPGISDPGEVLVSRCFDEGIVVSSVPGPAACITALTMSGLSTRRFAFEAFLPREKRDRQRILEELKNETRTIIIYEAPHHLKDTINELYKTLGDRRITLLRELTKKFEEADRTTLLALINRFSSEEPKGECVLVIEGKSFEEIDEENQQKWESMSIEEHMEYYLNQGNDKKSAMKLVAKDRGVSKRDIYNYLLNLEED